MKRPCCFAEKNNSGLTRVDYGALKPRNDISRLVSKRMHPWRLNTKKEKMC